PTPSMVPLMLSPRSEASPVDGVGIDGDIAFIWGSFTSVRGEPREGFAAIDLLTREALPLELEMDGTLFGVEPGPDALYLAGSFVDSDGAFLGSLVAVDRDDGTLLETFATGVMGFLDVPQLLGDELVVTGFDLRVDDQDLGQVLWLDAATGALSNPQPPLNAFVYDISPLGSELVVSSRDVPAAVSGLPTDRGLFAVDLATRALRDWSPPVTSIVQHVLGMDDVVILGGSFLQVDGVEGELFAVDAISGAPVPWDVSYNGTITHLHRLGDQVAFTTDISEILVVDPPGAP
ncbi:MAG: hypothetical protein AAF211_04300, partial [Myxococcota bacterium]